MKKSMLAMSVAAAIGGLGFAGGAQAIVALGGGADATVLELNPNGIGHQLVVPYFSTQNGNVTLLNIVNTDTVNGKLVKVRFRGAGNSDDLFDFQVAMSPGDVWTASVVQGESGASTVSTQDASCTIGLGNGTFSTVRTDPGKDLAETREGYVEFINMADIPPAFFPTAPSVNSELYDTIKHSNGVATCSLAVLDRALGTDVNNEGAANARGLDNPTTGLIGDWILLNQTTTAAWSGAATALEARVVARGAPGAGNIVFWPQKEIPATNSPIGSVTADPILRLGTAGVVAQYYDLPDLSTPYVTLATSAEAQADQTTAQLAVTSVSNQFETSTGIAAVTDWLFSQPTRRYHVAVDYTPAGTPSLVFRELAGTGVTVGDTAGNGTAYYNAVNTRLFGAQACLDTTNGPGRDSLFDREETTPDAGTDPFVPSPQQPNTPTVLLLCGEANVVSINADGVEAASALSASVARADYSMDYVNGWARWDLAGNTTPLGIPVLGAAFMRAANGPVNYGFAFPHKTTRPAIN